MAVGAGVTCLWCRWGLCRWCLWCRWGWWRWGRWRWGRCQRRRRRRRRLRPHFIPALALDLDLAVAFEDCWTRESSSLLLGFFLWHSAHFLHSSLEASSGPSQPVGQASAHGFCLMKDLAFCWTRESSSLLLGFFLWHSAHFLHSSLEASSGPSQPVGQ